MSFLDMVNELTGVLPRMPYNYAEKTVNRALLETYRASLWSFLTFESNWTSPAWLTTGTVTVTQGSNQIVFNAAAAAAINAIGLVPSAVTQRQFRIGIGTIYNIWDWDGTDTATLDRTYQEASSSGSSFMIFQCYYALPFPDFKGWARVRDMANYNDLFTNKSRAWVDVMDPQRTFYYIPTHVVFYRNDPNPDSDTYGYPMFELWGPPSYVLTYQLWGYRKGTELVEPADELPNGLGEDVVMAKARKYAYEWAEANREKINGASNYFALKRDADVDFKMLVRDYRKQDREMFDAFHTRFRRSRAYPGAEGMYNSISGIASPGAAF